MGAREQESFLRLTSYPSFASYEPREHDAVQQRIRAILARGDRERWLLRFDELALGDLLARGSNALVYACEWRGISIVVKKTMRKRVAMLLDLMREVEVCSTLRHPNIATFLGITVSPPPNEDVYIALERVDGWTLSDYVLNHGDHRHDAAQIRDLVNVVRFLHRCSTSVVYRDLKPDNLMVDRRTKCLKLIDFGLSRFVEASDDDAYDLSGETGTLRYMAPEVARSEPYNLNVDVYSAGLVIYFILTKRVPFEGFDVARMRAYARDAAPFDLAPMRARRAARAYTELVARCVEKDPRRRASIDDAHALLERVETARASGVGTGLGSVFAHVIATLSGQAPVASHPT